MEKKDSNKETCKKYIHDREYFGENDRCFSEVLVQNPSLILICRVSHQRRLEYEQPMKTHV